MTETPIDLQTFADHASSWLCPVGPDADVVISCRVRLARNVGGFPFVSRMDVVQAEEVARKVKAHLVEARLDGDTIWIAMGEAPPLLRLVLRERNLISRDLAPVDTATRQQPGRCVAFGADESVSAMVNEEDHLRIQSMSPGFDLDGAWYRARELDCFLEERLEFVHTRELGYLTGCPTNVGTGLRASAMLHLPALSMVRSELEKVFTASQRTGLAVRGMYGEGSRAAGDFYQISNQVTLGRTESQLVDDLRALVPVIVNFERTVRAALLKDQRGALEDRVSRSHGTLRTARAMPTEGALAHLSNIRLGHHLGLYGATPLDTLNELGVQIQRGHIQVLNSDAPPAKLLEASERDRLRAGFLRRRLGE